MATPAQASLLMSIPLELRHHIYALAAARSDGPNKVLRRWFEKKEVKEIIAKQTADEPNGAPFKVLYSGDVYGSDDDGEDRAENDEDDEEDGQEDDEDGDDDTDEDDPDVDDMIDDDSDDDIEEDEDHDMDDDNADMDDTQAAPTPAPARIVMPHRKWRHIPKFLRISDCPPPLNLFLTSKALNQEAKDWFYDVAIIRIDATGSFAHTSMFEEALLQIADAVFSPFESIRKVEVKFVWDTEWLRGPDCKGNEPFFQCMLYVRAEKVAEILSRAPELKNLVIQWHDSVQDSESISFKSGVMNKFNGLPVKVQFEEHYLTPGEKPRRNTAVGRKRLEFQGIADAGFNLT